MEEYCIDLGEVETAWEVKKDRLPSSVSPATTSLTRGTYDAEGQ